MKPGNYTTFSVSFYCREAKKNRQGLSPIETSIVMNGRRWIFSLPQKENPEVFKNALKSKRNNAIKEYLEEIRSKIRDCQLFALQNDTKFDIELVKSFVLHGGIRPITVSELFEEYMSQLKRRIGVNLTYKTYRKFELSRDKFLEMVSPTDPVSSINGTTIRNFMTELERVYEYQTTMGYASKLKSVLLYAVKNKMLSQDPFEGIPIRRWNREVQFLTDSELNRIKELPLANQSLAKIRDIFIFQANCGLSFADMRELKKEDFLYDENGQCYIAKNRVKTEIPFISVILPDGMEILKKYNFQLPLISIEKVNAYLKIIQDLSGINKPLHTHIARHTYATRCLNAGVRIEVVSKLLGHTNIRQTQHYAKLLKNSIVDEVSRCFKK